VLPVQPLALLWQPRPLDQREHGLRALDELSQDSPVARLDQAESAGKLGEVVVGVERVVPIALGLEVVPE
jgi:hypothetical protein